MAYGQVSIQLTSPIAFQSRDVVYPITLDSILTYLVGNKNNTREPSIEDLKKGLEIPIVKVGRKHPYYKASAMLVPRTSSKQINTFPWTTKSDWHISAYELSKDISLVFAKDILDGSGVYRAWKQKLLVIAAPVIWFSFDGDIGAVRDILNDLTHLGVRRSAGFGKVAGVDVKECDVDFSCFDSNGFPARFLPVEEVGEGMGFPVEYAAYKPPYWLPENMALCYSVNPDRFLPFDKVPVRPQLSSASNGVKMS